MIRKFFLFFLGTLVVITLIAIARASRLNKRNDIKFSKGFLMSLPLPIIIIVTAWATIFILYFFLVATEHTGKMIFELVAVVIVWLGFFGKIVIKKPNIEKSKDDEKNKGEEDKYEVGLASVGGEPVAYIYLPGRHCLWQGGLIDSGMIVLDATIGIFAHVFKGVPIFKIDNGGPNPTKVNAGVVDITINFRRRLDYEDPMRTLEFLKSGRMDGAEKALIARVDPALRDVIGGIDSKIVLEEKGDAIIPFVQTRLLDGYDPTVDFLRNGLPDRFNIGLRFFEIVISDVKGEGDVATGAKVTAATFEAQADKVTAEATVERLNLYKKAGVQGPDAVDLDLTNRGKASTTILRGGSTARRVVQPGQGNKKRKNQGGQANLDDVVAFINQDGDVNATDPGFQQDTDDDDDDQS